MSHHSRPWQAEAWQWDDANESELAHHHIDVREVYQVWASRPTWVPNRKRRPGDWKMLGTTLGGRRLTVIVRYLHDQRVLRPITGWDATPAELAKYF